MDPKTYPFVRGTACDAPWDSVEKKPGVYDWSTMDQAIERAYKDDIFSLVEVHRGEPEVPALRPPPEVRVVPGYGKGTKYGPDAKSEKKKDKKRE
ncbi:MAG: hypothetical protein EB141_17580 [Verrucomicrobia bacterium]|nr:hypothetical protein [Verrucomicrobiota bacterium]NBU10072.1 hypothetical protein [Pseudomonadota bacterium]NDB77425.1 hypothetical protein [Verrucomicrobiota bacterium]NDD38327.1 hypothetical protein [Verrucomicrobiota bacterium]